MRNLSLKRLKSKSKQKTKKRTQLGGGWKFWKQILTGRLFGVGGPSKPRSRSPPKSKSKTRSKPKSRSKTRSRSPPKPKVTSRVDIVVKEHEKSMLNLKKVKKLSNSEYNEFVRRITK